MAGIITHVVAAREISRLLPEGTIDDIGLFYMGNLAPDAVHAREGFVRAFKKHTHFRDDIVDRDFIIKENRTYFYERIKDFITQNLNRKDGRIDLYRGYVVHNLIDELYLLTLRQEFCEVMKKKGIDQNEPMFFQTIITDMRRNDFLLMENYAGIEEIREIVENAQIYPVEGYVSAEEINHFREWMLQKHFYSENEIISPVYISFEKTKEFIAMAAEDIVRRLSDGVSFPRMF